MNTSKIFLAALVLLSATAASAQQRYMRVWNNGDSQRLPMADIEYTQNGSQININGQSFATAEVDSITLVHTIRVDINGNQVAVDLDNAPGVSYTADGGHVTITNTNVDQEMEFALSGTSTDGSFTYVGSYKCKFHLNGLNLTSQRGAAFDIQCGKRIDLILADGTSNSFADNASGVQKAALYCKGHMEIDGGGSLTVAGNTRHAIGTNEYLIIKRKAGKVVVTHAEGDAIHAGQYFQMNGGMLEINGMAGDGIQAELTNDPTDELNGQLFINGGSIVMNVAGTDVKGIKADADMAITGGDININVTGAGSKGISAPSNLLINQASAATNIYIKAAGSIYSDPVTDEDVRCMGMNIKGNLTIESGTVTVENPGKGSRGIKVAGKYTKGKDAKVNASIRN